MEWTEEKQYSSQLINGKFHSRMIRVMLESMDSVHHTNGLVQCIANISIQYNLSLVDLRCTSLLPRAKFLSMTWDISKQLANIGLESSKPWRLLWGILDLWLESIVQKGRLQLFRTYHPPTNKLACFSSWMLPLHQLWNWKYRIKKSRD